jgi:hypothetical protein
VPVVDIEREVLLHLVLIDDLADREPDRTCIVFPDYP